MPNIPSFPENFSIDEQCWVWFSGSESLTNLRRLISLDCADPTQQTEKQDITPSQNSIPITVVKRAPPNLGGISQTDYDNRIGRTAMHEKL